MTRNTNRYLIFLLLIFLKVSESIRIGLTKKPETYEIEHEISSTQAKNSALTLELTEAVPPGCQLCSRSEIAYCSSPSIINDHCCCDRKFIESFPFIPHTCYVGDKLCTPVLNCDDYMRLRKCCCHNILLAKWKATSDACSSNRRFGCSYHLFSLFMILYIVNMYL